MAEIEERMKKIRKELDLKQGEFAERLKMSQGALSDFENGRRLLSDRNIKLLCLTFGVREKWLREGIGEMFIPSPNSSYAAIIDPDGEPLAEDEMELISLYRGMIPDNKKLLLETADIILKAEKNTAKAIEEGEAMPPPLSTNRDMEDKLKFILENEQALKSQSQQATHPEANGEKGTHPVHEQERA